MKTTRTKVSTITCPSCNDEIYSRATHDFQWCSCQEVAIDGGFDYTKVCFKTQPPKKRNRYIAATKQQLYDDWNRNINKFGKITA